MSRADPVSTAGSWGQGSGNAVVVKHVTGFSVLPRGNLSAGNPTRGTSSSGRPSSLPWGRIHLQKFSRPSLSLLAGIFHAFILSLRIWLPSLNCWRPQVLGGERAGFPAEPRAPSSTDNPRSTHVSHGKQHNQQRSLTQARARRPRGAPTRTRLVSAQTHA